MRKIATALVLGVLVSGAAQAELQDRGGGLLYDTVLNVTWLQDASFARTSGYPLANGYDYDYMGMTWSNAMTWVANLSYVDTVRGLTYNDWRLPTVKPIGETFTYSYNNYGSVEHTFDGSTDWGYNITSPNSELAYMYYVNLGLESAYSLSPTGALVYENGGIAYGRLPNSDGSYNVGQVQNVTNFLWSGTAANDVSPGNVWHFGAFDGHQDAVPTGQAQGWLGTAWAVRDGDVIAAVPEPESYGMMLAGLGLLGAIARRKKRLNA